MTENTAFFTPKSKRNIRLVSPRFVYAKLIFINSLIYTASFVLGCIIFHSLKINEGQIISERIAEYFSIDFSKSHSIYSYIDILLDISGNDISHLIIIFTAGFTMLSGIIIPALHSVRGFSLGFTISYLTFAEKNNLLSTDNANMLIIIYSALCAVTAVVLIHFGVKTTCFSDEFKALGGRPRMIFKSKSVYLQLIRFLIAFGAILLLNSIRSVV